MKTKIFKSVPALILCMVFVLSPFSAAAAGSQLPEIIEDNGLPVVNITIDENAEGFGTIDEMNSSPDHSVKCTGSVKITVPDGYKGDYSRDVLSDTKDLALDYIRGRGNTSWEPDNIKKPYKFKLSKKTNLLGMGKNKHWALIANDYDPTLLRNRIMSYIGIELGLDYTPKCFPLML